MQEPIKIYLLYLNEITTSTIFTFFIVSSVLFTNSLLSDPVEWIYVLQRSNFSSFCAVTYWILFSTSFALFLFTILNTRICLLKHFSCEAKINNHFSAILFNNYWIIFLKIFFSIHKSHAWEINFFLFLILNYIVHHSIDSCYFLLFLVLLNESLAFKALSRQINAFMYSCCVGLLIGFIICMTHLMVHWLSRVDFHMCCNC